jgi:tRNA-dihydrouridine synthase 3
MVLARRLKQRRRGEFALIRRAAEESTFAVQLAGNSPDEMAWAAALVESRGADFVDFNCGCPIDYFTRKGLGAALSRQPNKIRKIVTAMTAAVKIPVTVKIRLGWKDDDRNALEQAQAAVDGGAAALTVHGRTREARYRLPAEWDAIAAIAAAVPVPVVGNGDLLYPHEITERLTTSGCVGVMVARGALIKPWIFREATEGYWDISAEERVAIYRE